MSENGIVWCVAQSSGVLLENWGDEYIVYHPLSGETHQMDVFSITVLELLIEGQRSEKQLLSDICQLYAVDNDAKTQGSLIQIINHFDQIGLIQPSYL